MKYASNLIDATIPKVGALKVVWTDARGKTHREYYTEYDVQRYKEKQKENVSVLNKELLNEAVKILRSNGLEAKKTKLNKKSIIISGDENDYSFGRTAFNILRKHPDKFKKVDFLGEEVIIK